MAAEMEVVLVAIQAEVEASGVAWVLADLAEEGAQDQEHLDLPDLP
jgi:hypothetical protein